MIIKKLPSTERPYEKAQMYGIDNLSNSELLAIIIKTGTKEKTSVQLAQEILSIESKNKENIQFLQDISLEELTKIKGIGIVKAIQIKAVCEMAKRISKPLNANKVQIRSSASVANLLMNEMKYEKREKVKVNQVEGKVLSNNIGYINFTSFDETTADDFKAKFEELNKQGIKSLIIDLRNNGGGIVDQALQIADYVADKDSVLLYEVDKNNKETVKKAKTDPIINMPIIILTNENTASASEILAGALKDLGKAKTVGTTTYGKGVIQQILKLSDGSGLKVTIEEYQTPNRNKIHKIGITPDEEVKLPDSVTNVLNVTESEDTQLQKAIEMLK